MTKFYINSFLFFTCLLFNLQHTKAQSFEEFENFTNFSPAHFTIFNEILYVSSTKSIIKRENGSWNNYLPQAFPEPPNWGFTTSFFKIIDENNIIIVGENSGQNARVKKWNGNTWIDLFTVPNLVQNITDIHYVSDQEIYFAATNAYLNNYFFKYNGNNITDLNFPYNAFLDTQIYFYASDEIYLTSRGNTLLYNGVSWENVVYSESHPHPNSLSKIDDNNLYHSGFEQLRNYHADGNYTTIGDIYNETDVHTGHVDHVIAFNHNDIYASVRRKNGFVDAFFVSHWDGNEWNRLWDFNSSDQITDFLAYFKVHDNFLYAQINNRSIYRLELQNLTTEDFIKDETKIRVFPNPSNGKVNIVYQKDEEVQSAKVFNVSGLLVKEVHNKKDLDLGDLKKGVYLLQVISKSGNSSTHKIILM